MWLMCSLVAMWKTSPVAAISTTCSSRDVSRGPDGDGGWRSTPMSARWTSGGR